MTQPGVFGRMQPADRVWSRHDFPPTSWQYHVPAVCAQYQSRGARPCWTNTSGRAFTTLGSMQALVLVTLPVLWLDVFGVVVVVCALCGWQGVAVIVLLGCGGGCIVELVLWWCGVGVGVGVLGGLGGASC